MTEQTAERPKRRRWARWITSAVAGVILLLTLYILGWCLYHWGDDGERLVPKPIRMVLHVFYYPLDEYMEGDRFGSDTLCTLYMWVSWRGEESWHNCTWLMMNAKDREIPDTLAY